MIAHVVSISSGKDSTATMLLAIEQFGRDRCRFVFADTGNEHKAVYDYLTYLEIHLGIVIDRVRGSFSDEIIAKRMFIARDRRSRREYTRVPICDEAGQPLSYIDADGEKRPRMKKVGSGRRVRWSNKAKRRALAILYPTGNPYLDLCMWKGRFPSRKAQFCTEELKTGPLVEYQLALLDAGFTVISWQGIRRDESMNRSDALKFERLSPRLYAWRPLVDWTAQQTVDFVLSRGVRLNPLYSQGMGRVGCMPCINANKGEFREISVRFPEHIARIDQWEQIVSQASKREAATFVPAPGITPREAKEHGIYSIIEWSKTTRGGRQLDLLADLPSEACKSSYGLCERAA